MSDDSSFRELVAQVRQGDGEAAARLVQRYESELRAMARVRLTDPSMRRVVDSMDVCQSILAGFFVRAASGDFELDTPEQLMKLLATMIRNKVTDHARRMKADRRDVRRQASAAVEEFPLSGGAETPSAIVASRELLEEFESRLSSEERHLVQRRRDGLGRTGRGVGRIGRRTPQTSRPRGRACGD